MQKWYTNVVPLDRDKHAELELAAEPNFAHAARDVSLPLSIEEFAFAAASLPIVFSVGDPPVPLGLAGLRRDRNVFVDETGHWARGVYIPVGVRNYPFIVLDIGEGRELVGIDEAAPHFVESGGQKLFGKGEPTELLKQRIQLCRSYRDSMRRTTEFTKALSDGGLLDPQHARVALPGGGANLQLDGFAIVSPQRFDGMTDTAFLDWRHRGWLLPVLHHWAAGSQWQRLVMQA